MSDHDGDAGARGKSRATMQAGHEETPAMGPSEQMDLDESLRQETARSLW